MTFSFLKKLLFRFTNICVILLNDFFSSSIQQKKKTYFISSQINIFFLSCIFRYFFFFFVIKKKETETTELFNVVDVLRTRAFVKLLWVEFQVYIAFCLAINCQQLFMMSGVLRELKKNVSHREWNTAVREKHKFAGSTFLRAKNK